MKVSGLHIFETELSVGINEVPINGAVVVIDFEGETKFLTKLSNTGLTPTTTMQQFIALKTQWDYLGKPSELELIEEAGKRGWRLYKRNPEHYGNIGSDAIDFSITDGGFPSSGATGDGSFARGFNSHAVGMYSTAEGMTTLTDVVLITGPQGGGSPGTETLPDGAYIVYGREEGSIAYRGVPEGAVVLHGAVEGSGEEEPITPIPRIAL